MSGTLPASPPQCVNPGADQIELLVEARTRNLGGFSVRRLLPSAQRRLIGPFIFFDHMGPAQLAPGTGFDVRPHPHVCLATLTYLFDGEIDHRDSLGTVQTIRPGDVNWMLAGSGIVHSERSSSESRAHGVRMHGIQSWVALPSEQEETAPRFEHHPSSAIPTVRVNGTEVNIIAGTAYGARSPVGVLSPTFYVHARLIKGARLPVDAEHEQRAVYVAEGRIACCDKSFAAGSLVVLRPGTDITIAAEVPARILLIGGAPLEGERHIEWNFIASSKERIALAKDDWQNDRFAKIPGDDQESIPLPRG